MPLMLMDHARDPKQDVLERVGDISEFQLADNQVLIGLYDRPDRTASGLWLSDKTKDEDKWQGKTGLVLKMGPIAFKDDDKVSFNGFVPQVGDWVSFKVADGWPLCLNTSEGHCRLFRDQDIRMIVPSPDRVW